MSFGLLAPGKTNTRSISHSQYLDVIPYFTQLLSHTRTRQLFIIVIFFFPSYYSPFKCMERKSCSGRHAHLLQRLETHIKDKTTVLLLSTISSSETSETYSHRMCYFLKKPNLPSFILATDPQGHCAEDL